MKSPLQSLTASAKRLLLGVAVTATLLPVISSAQVIVPQKKTWGRSNLANGLSANSKNVIRQIVAGPWHMVALRGDGTVTCWSTSNSGAGAPPDGLRDVQAIAAGDDFTLALRNDGTVISWGAMGSGSVPTGLANVVQIAAYASHCVALKSDGTVVCWGSNGSGESTVPAGLTGVIQVAAGYWHTAAVKSDGTVVLWGKTSDGQCTQPKEHTKVAQVACGDHFTAFLKADGTAEKNGLGGAFPADMKGMVSISAGGDQFLGLKGNGVLVPWRGSLTQGVPSIPNVVQVGCGRVVVPAFALSSDGSAYQWDGDGTHVRNLLPPEVNDIAALADAVQHSAFLLADGTVTCAGSNFRGECTVPPGLTGVVQVAVGSYHTVALKSDGAVVAWGWDNYGQSTVPAGLSNVVQIDARDYRTAAVKADGTVVCWGENQSGSGDVPAGLTGVVQVATGSMHTLALKSDGTVTFWGRNIEHQGRPPAGLAHVIRVAAGYKHSMALRSDGTVVCWGDNTYGQCDIPAGLTNVVAIAAEGSECVALKADGTIALWGGSGANASLPIAGAAKISANGGIGVQMLNAVNLSIDSGLIAEGHSAVGKIFLTNPVDSGGIDIALATDNTAIQIPATVHMSRGDRTATFTIRSALSGTLQKCMVTATYVGSQSRAVLMLAPRPTFTSLTINSPTVVGGSINQEMGLVQMSGPVLEDTTVTLTSSNTLATVPASVVIHPGFDRAAFKISHVLSTTDRNITVSATQHGVKQTATFLLKRMSVATYTLSPLVVDGGTPAKLTITMDSKSPTARTITLTSSLSSAASVPASVDVPALATTVTVPVTTYTVGASVYVKLTATYNGQSQVVKLKVRS